MICGFTKKIRGGAKKLQNLVMTFFSSFIYIYIYIYMKLLKKVVQIWKFYPPLRSFFWRHIAKIGYIHLIASKLKFLKIVSEKKYVHPKGTEKKFGKMSKKHCFFGAQIFFCVPFGCTYFVSKHIFETFRIVSKIL